MFLVIITCIRAWYGSDTTAPPRTLVAACRLRLAKPVSFPLLPLLLRLSSLLQNLLLLVMVVVVAGQAIEGSRGAQ